MTQPDLTTKNAPSLSAATFSPPTLEIPAKFLINITWGKVLFICATPENSQPRLPVKLFCANELLLSGFALGHTDLATLVCQELKIPTLRIYGGGVFTVLDEKVQLLRSSGSFGPALLTDLQREIALQLGERAIINLNDAAATSERELRLKIFHQP